MRIGHALFHLTAQGGKFGEAADHLRIAAEPGELVAHVAGALDAVGARHRDGRADQAVQQGQLVTHRGEAMELHEGERGGAGQIVAPLEEHPLPGNEDVVEDGERLDHFVGGGDGPVEGIVGAVQKVGAVEPQSRSGDGHAEGHRPGLVSRTHAAAGEDDDLVHVGRARGVDLGAAHHDSIGPLLHHVDVEVRVFLLRWALAAIAFYVGLRDCQRQVAVAASLVEVIETLQALLLAGAPQHALQREEGVGADLLNKNNERRPFGGARLDQLGA